MSESAELTRRAFLSTAGVGAAVLAVPGPAEAASTKGAPAGPVVLPAPSGPGAPAPALRPAPFAEAVARAFRDSGVRVVTNVPATACTELYDAWTRLEGKRPVYSFNEEVAFCVAHGAALAGVRSAAVLKSHGIAKAGNALVDSMTAFTSSGFVVLVSDDPAGSHSDNVFDGEALLGGFGIPYRRVTAAAVYREILSAFAFSEKMQLPVALLFDAAEASRASAVPEAAGMPPAQPVHSSSPSGPPRYERDVFGRVLCPPLAPFQKRLRDAQGEGKDWKAVPRPPLPEVPGGLPARWQAPVVPYLPVFTALRQLRASGGAPFVAGDAGLGVMAAFPPFSCLDVCTYYGGSIPLATGAWMAGHDRPWAVAGDFAFLAGGGLGLAEAMHRGASVKLLVLYNGKAETTGGQRMDPAVFEQVLGGYRAITRTLHHPEDASEALGALREAHEAPGPRIVVADYV